LSKITEGCRNFYDAYAKKKLPADLQTRCESIMEDLKLGYEESYFKIGFIVGLYVEQHRREIFEEDYELKGTEIIVCIVKDYYIDLDGKKTKISGQKYSGVFTGKEAPYFEGAVFDKMPDGSYQLGGTVSLSKEEFTQNVKLWMPAF